MKARQSKRAKRLFRDREKGRLLLKQLRERDKLDGEPIKTDFGTFIKA